MKRSIARKWAAALESGDYKQIDGSLRIGNSFCCLGVLCNIHAQKHPEIASLELDKHAYLDAEVDLPNEVADWSGMHSHQGKIQSGVHYKGQKYNCLIELNDIADMTFPEIAKVIRKHWKEL